MLHLWLSITVQAKVVLLVMAAFALVALVRFARLALRLYGRTGDSVETADPHLLVANALKCRLPSALSDEKGKAIGNEASDKEKTMHLLRTADHRFRFLWASFYADVVSGRRASVLVLLLSAVLVGVDPFGPFQPPLFEKAEELVALLTIGASLSATLYGLSSIFERALSKRKAGWQYFYSKRIDDLSCQ